MNVTGDLNSVMNDIKINWAEVREIVGSEVNVVDQVNSSIGSRARDKSFCDDIRLNSSY